MVSIPLGKISKYHNADRETAKPLVSIITVVLNSATHLKLTIESVQGQSYREIEYIVIDGGSLDDTLNVIRESEAQIDCIVSEKDDGIFDAINKGLLLSTGDLICVLHAGDRYDSHAIERMVESVESNPGSIVYTDYYYGAFAREAPDRLTAAFNLFNMGVAHQSLMVPRNLYTNVIGPYRTDFRIVSDHIWMRRAYQLGVPFRRVPEKLLYFDDTGLSSGRTPTDRELFALEAAQRVSIFFPFVPTHIGRSIFQLRFGDKPLKALNDWVESMDNIQSQNHNWSQFKASLDAYIPFVRARRIAAASIPDALRPGSL